jgi:hypothetical protein
MMNWERFGRKRSWNKFKVLYYHSPGGTDEKISIRIAGLRAEI